RLRCTAEGARGSRRARCAGPVPAVSREPAAARLGLEQGAPARGTSRPRSRTTARALPPRSRRTARRARAACTAARTNVPGPRPAAAPRRGAGGLACRRRGGARGGGSVLAARRCALGEWPGPLGEPQHEPAVVLAHRDELALREVEVEPRSAPV